MAHTGHGWYKVIKGGWLNCTHNKNYRDTMQVGMIMHIDRTDSCSNYVI
jgi:hypothetical protein